MSSRFGPNFQQQKKFKKKEKAIRKLYEDNILQ